MEIIKGLDSWFSERLQGLDAFRPETIAYVTGVLKMQSRPRQSECLAGKSIVMTFAEARSTGDFVQFQRLGDWILFADIILPDSINNDRDVIETIGRVSYYTCYRMMRCKCDVYEELADQLPVLARHVRCKLV